MDIKNTEDALEIRERHSFHEERSYGETIGATDNCARFHVRNSARFQARLSQG
jgi:hypothetical protein